MGCIVTRSTPKGNSDYGSDQSFENNSLAEDIHKNRKETENRPASRRDKPRQNASSSNRRFFLADK